MNKHENFTYFILKKPVKFKLLFFVLYITTKFKVLLVDVSVYTLICGIHMNFLYERAYYRYCKDIQKSLESASIQHDL